MAKFELIDYWEIGNWIRELTSDPVKVAAFKALAPDEQKKAFEGKVKVKDKKWEDVTLRFHFDEDNTMNISIPYGKDVQEGLQEVKTGLPHPYTFPSFYKDDPSKMPDPADRENAYLQRLGDYVMTRCK